MKNLNDFLEDIASLQLGEAYSAKKKDSISAQEMEIFSLVLGLAVKLARDSEQVSKRAMRVDGEICLKSLRNRPNY